MKLILNSDVLKGFDTLGSMHLKEKFLQYRELYKRIVFFCALGYTNIS